jgi:hypothetical protein
MTLLFPRRLPHLINAVVVSNRFRAHEEATVLSCTLPGQAHMNTNPLSVSGGAKRAVSR